MSDHHGTACGRRLASAVERSGGSKDKAAQQIHEHCGVSLLRAHRTAYGYTLTDVTELLKQIMRDRGTPADGLAHQMVSRWESGADMPSPRYFDALCFLYRTRPDRLGFGNDYSKVEDDVERRQFLKAAGAVVAPAAVMGSGNLLADLGEPGSRTPVRGRRARDLVELLEERAEESGYQLYTASPAEYVPARMMDMAGIQKLLLHGQTSDLQRRLHRTLAKNAGFIGVRLTDVANVRETFNWFGVARVAARRAQDAGVEAWIAGHLCDAHACYWHSLRQGLETARVAQLANGTAPNSAGLFGYLSEAGVQARLGRGRETLEAVRQAERIFNALPPEKTTADGFHVPEYFLRWHQSNALSLIGESRLADPLRRRALELPGSRGDVVGRSLLLLDEASLLFPAGDLDRACELVREAWESVPAEYHVGQIPARTNIVLRGLPANRASTSQVSELTEYLGSLADAAPVA
jgi:transcriptional regulator with XRE-family HTH domain